MSIIERAVRLLKPFENDPHARSAESAKVPKQPTYPPLPRRTQTGPIPRPSTGPIPRPSTGPVLRTSTGPIPRPTTGPIARLSPVPPAERPFDTIDISRLESLGMVLPDGKRTQISEEFRVIKRRLLQSAKANSLGPKRRSNLILVTSAFPNEGKTFSSINLAISMSLELDTTVLLVDADVAQAQRGDFLGLKPREGLMDLLLEPHRSIEKTIIRTNIDRLEVMLAGRPHHQANELLASDSMSRLLDQLTSQGPDRIVIFDAPPLLVTTEAGTLAHRASQIVLVVEADKTGHTALKSALAQLEGCAVFGLLNKSTGSMGQDVFDYGRYRYSE